MPPRRTAVRALSLAAVLVLVGAACGETDLLPKATRPDTAAPGTTPPSTSRPPPPATTATPPTTSTTGNRVWRVLADEARGRPYEVSVATSQESLQRMWDYHRFTTPVPAVDVAAEVVVLLTQAVSSSCPDIDLADLVIAGNVVYGEFVNPGEQETCTADATPHSFVLAVDRAALPRAFTLQLTEELACGGCDADELDVDLDDPDLDEQLWGFGRILVVRDGPPILAPEVSFGFATPTYGIVRNWALESPRGGPELALVIEPADGTFILDAGRADCSAGDCGDNAPDLIDPCRAFVPAEPGADVWAVYTVAADGSCTWEIADSYELPERPDQG